MQNFAEQMAAATRAENERQAEAELEKNIEIRMRIIAHAYDRAAAYSNLIIGAGYAASFAIWSLTKDYLPENAAITIGLSLGTSVFVFCGWEVFKMIYTSSELRALTAVVTSGKSGAEFFKAIAVVEDKSRRDVLRLYRFWVFILLVTIPTGFGAAALLFYNFVAHLLKLPHWPA